MKLKEARMCVECEEVFAKGEHTVCPSCTCASLAKVDMARNQQDVYAYCDGPCGKQEEQPIKRLDLGMGAGVFLCRNCWMIEMVERSIKNMFHGDANWKIAMWDDAPAIDLEDWK